MKSTTIKAFQTLSATLIDKKKRTESESRHLYNIKLKHLHQAEKQFIAFLDNFLETETTRAIQKIKQDKTNSLFDHTFLLSVDDPRIAPFIKIIYNFWFSNLLDKHKTPWEPDLRCIHGTMCWDKLTNYIDKFQDSFPLFYLYISAFLVPEVLIEDSRHQIDWGEDEFDAYWEDTHTNTGKTVAVLSIHLYDKHS